MNLLAQLIRLLLAALLLFAGSAHAITTSTTTFTLSPSPSSAGQKVTLTASVAGSLPGGVVTFKQGATTLGAAAVNAGAAKLVVGSLGVGSHGLTATYSGDLYNTTSTASVTATVSIATPTLSLTVPTAAQQGQYVSLVANFTGAFAPSGSVTFTDGGTTLGTAAISGASASLSTSSLALGSHGVAASYAGDANNTAATTSTATLTVSARSNMTWQYGYDTMGRPNTVVDPNGLASYTYYDALGRAIQTQQPANTGTTTLTITDYRYDLQDARTSVIDPRLLTTTYTVKGLATLTQQSSPDTATSTFTYNVRGQVLTSTDARGKTSTFSYDSLGRPTGASYPTGAATAFEYDGGASPYAGAKGELTKMTDESGNTVFAYDSLGRLGTKTVVIGSKTFTVTYGWGNSGSALDKLTSITYPSGTRVNYSYDSYGSVSAVTVNSVNTNGVGQSGTTQTLLNTITYNAEQKVTGWQWSDGKARPIGYDSYGEMVSYALGDPNGSSTAAGSLRTLTRDTAGRITAYAHTNNASAVPSLAQSFAYDNLNRLTANTQNASSFAYSYDATGNRTARTVGGSTYTTTVSVSSNRLTAAQSAAGTASYSYDAMGNIVGDGSTTFGYSDRGRLTSAVTASGTVTYTINGLGQRARKTGPSGVVPTGASYYVYDEAGQLLGEYDANGAPVYETVYLGGLPVGVLKHTGTAGTNDLAAQIYNLHADHIATPRLITRQDHTIVWRWDTAEAFGSTAPDQNPSSLGTFTYNQRFPGQTFDLETGLFQNWHRDYDSQVGRYRQSDPIGLAGGINTFAYVGGSPVAYIDPNGLEKLVLFGSNDFAMQSAAARDPDIPGTLIIYGHGNSSSIADDRNGRAVLNSSQAAALAKKSGLWKPGMPVKVQACEVAKEKNGFTQGMANELGVQVTGPNGFLEVMPSLSGGYGFSGIWGWTFAGFKGSPGGYVTSFPRK